MPVRIYTTNAGTDLSDAESALLADLIARHGRAVLLAPTFAELDLCRHDAAAAGVSLGIDYKTPTSWLRSLWGAFGATGRFRQPATPDAVFGQGHASRRCRFAAAASVQSGHGAHARAQRPKGATYYRAAGGTESASESDACGNNCQPELQKAPPGLVCSELLRSASRTRRFGPSVDIWSSVRRLETYGGTAPWPINLPACTRAVCVRGVTSFTHGLLLEPGCQPWRTARKSLSCLLRGAGRRDARRSGHGFDAFVTRCLSMRVALGE